MEDPPIERRRKVWIIAEENHAEKEESPPNFHPWFHCQICWDRPFETEHRTNA